MLHVAVLIARLTLGAMWILAACAKLGNPEARGPAIEVFGFARGRAAHMLGLVLPYIELTLGILLVAGA